MSGGAGTDGRGGGGGGQNIGLPYTGGNGGSGLVIIRFPENFANATTTGLYTVGGGYRVYTFNGSGTITF
jgi:hypothetical protein